MPSGGKKRKAAKKKMEKVSNTESTTNSQGNDDLKTHDEKWSDSGEGDSPESKEYLHALEEQEEGEEKKMDSSFGEPVFIDAASKPMEESEKIVTEVVQIEGEFRPNDDFHGRNISIDFVDTVEDLPANGSSPYARRSSSSSSSDAESPKIKNNSSAIESEKLEGSNLETKLGSPIEPVVSFPEEITQIVEHNTPIENVGNSDVFDLISKAKEDKMAPSLDNNFGDSGETDLVLPSSDQNVGSLTMIESGLKQNEDKLLPSLDAPLSVEAINGGEVEHRKKSDTHEISENQPLLDSSPPTVHRSSWKGCCGLFDVLTSSDR